eukprot:CAMPEP_0116833416 /NCGR_PEP_ID=MMETSP0418-20121206/6424_1 /TAXON_ID=1158023 /ORGANISM="Astrosyne radiata, Strain 13vi08-1A" /LENGTH=130 /DNA_ID=CAMNT_0004462863 /DNA_START=266 /DNA_END=658 /DNA_ORIENTATION=-
MTATDSTVDLGSQLREIKVPTDNDSTTPHVMGKKLKTSREHLGMPKNISFSQKNGTPEADKENNVNASESRRDFSGSKVFKATENNQNQLNVSATGSTKKGRFSRRGQQPVGLGEVGNVDEENTGECKQS